MQEFPCKNVPTGSQRHHYNFVTGDHGSKANDLWWYLACFSDGGCCAGPQRACTTEEKEHGIECSSPCLEGWPSYMIDHSAIRNRMMQVRLDVSSIIFYPVVEWHGSGQRSGTTCTVSCYGRPVLASQTAMARVPHVEATELTAGTSRSVLASSWFRKLSVTVNERK